MGRVLPPRSRPSTGVQGICSASELLETVAPELPFVKPAAARPSTVYPKHKADGLPGDRSRGTRAARHIPAGTRASTANAYRPAYFNINSPFYELARMQNLEAFNFNALNAMEAKWKAEKEEEDRLKGEDDKPLDLLDDDPMKIRRDILSHFGEVQELAVQITHTVDKLENPRAAALAEARALADAEEMELLEQMVSGGRGGNEADDEGPGSGGGGGGVGGGETEGGAAAELLLSLERQNQEEEEEAELTFEDIISGREEVMRLLEQLQPSEDYISGIASFNRWCSDARRKMMLEDRRIIELQKAQEKVEREANLSKVLVEKLVTATEEHLLDAGYAEPIVQFTDNSTHLPGYTPTAPPRQPAKKRFQATSRNLKLAGGSVSTWRNLLKSAPGRTLHGSGGNIRIEDFSTPSAFLGRSIVQKPVSAEPIASKTKLTWADIHKQTHAGASGRGGASSLHIGDRHSGGGLPNPHHHRRLVTAGAASSGRKPHTPGFLARPGTGALTARVPGLPPVGGASPRQLAYTHR